MDSCPPLATWRLSYEGFRREAGLSFHHKTVNNLSVRSRFGGSKPPLKILYHAGPDHLAGVKGYAVRYPHVRRSTSGDTKRLAPLGCVGQGEDYCLLGGATREQQEQGETFQRAPPEGPHLPAM